MLGATSSYNGAIKLIACNTNRPLAEEIASKVGIDLMHSEVARFADGEIGISIPEPVRGCDVFLIQPTAPPVNESIMELLIMADALRRASAGRITAVIPYFGYARQDRKTKAREPISAKLVANLISTAGITRVLTMDLHSDQLQGFFDILVDHMRGVIICAKHYVNKIEDFNDVIVVSPDLGSVSRARQMAETLDVPLAIVDKRRPNANESEVMNIIGKVRGKAAIIIDDLIDTGGSVINAAAALKENGVRKVYVCCTHGLFSGDALQRIENSEIDEVVSLNTVEIPPEKRISKLEVLSAADAFAEAIKIIHENTSISRMFDKYAPLRTAHR
ncbi:MAG: ribose-phosphate pyrophosphokinase [Defluviitaleaceae bacterium]|nr:ribose-phosphate pyrophosphokinase [Defluviitaleaceae bacterium]